MNHTLLFDFYEMTMANGYYCSGLADTVCYYDVFYRTIPDGGGFAIAAGLEQIIKYINELKFTDEDIAFLRAKGIFNEDYLEFLRSFHFTGDIWAVPEGTPIFPNEPVITVRARAIEAQFIETFLLLAINHQSLIATKANRIVRAADGRGVAEFGSRRAHGPDAAIYGARAAYIGGCSSTACTISDKLFGVPASGTMAHSWVQMFDSEYEAFKTYCEIYPSAPTLLVDTYSVLKSGIPNAIRAFNECLPPKGQRSCAIRIDSGDLTYLSKQARKMLDEAGYDDCRIVASNALDEHIIRDLLLQGACIDAFGVGESLITSRSTPVFGAVYKLAAIERDGEIIPKIKISENAAKITTPHFKKVYRLFSNNTGKAIADYICTFDESVDEKEPLVLFDPEHVWNRKTITDYTARQLLVPVFSKGKQVYTSPALTDIQQYCAREVAALWDEVKRFDNPHSYYVDLSQKLWDIKQDMLVKSIMEIQ